MRWFILLAFLGCGAPPLDEMPRCSPATFGRALNLCGDETRLVCVDRQDAPMGGCWVEHVPAPGRTVRAECVTTCR